MGVRGGSISRKIFFNKLGKDLVHGFNAMQLHFEVVKVSSAA